MIPAAFDYVRAESGAEAVSLIGEQDPKRIVHAGEEFFRVFMPLTHIGRVCRGGGEPTCRGLAPRALAVK